VSRGLFVTGAGTGVGKTLIACALVHRLRARGEAVRVLKPVATGFDGADAESDTALLLAAAGEPASPEAIAACTPWRFGPALAPAMAAAREGRAIPYDDLIGHCRAALDGEAFTIIEGIGGVMVPLGGGRTVADWIAALGIPAVLVAGSYLGALSHALTALAAARAAGIPVAGLVVSESEESPVPLAETVGALRDHAAGIPILAVPRLAPGPHPWERAPDLTGLFR